MSVDVFIRKQIDDALKEVVLPEVLNAISGLSMPSTEEEWLTKEEVAEWLKVAVSTIDNLRRQGVIKGYKIGRGEKATIRFKKSDIIRCIEAINN